LTKLQTVKKWELRHSVYISHHLVLAGYLISSDVWPDLKKIESGTDTSLSKPKPSGLRLRLRQKFWLIWCSDIDIECRFPGLATFRSWQPNYKCGHLHTAVFMLQTAGCLIKYCCLYRLHMCSGTICHSCVRFMESLSGHKLYTFISTDVCRSLWSRGKMPQCSVRDPMIESHCGQLCLSQSTAMYSLRHRLHTLTALQCLDCLSLPLSQSLCGMVK